MLGLLLQHGDEISHFAVPVPSFDRPSAQGCGKLLILRRRMETTKMRAISNFEQLQRLLAEPKKIVITMHQRPDADALGSSLALCLFLQKEGHQVTVIAPTPYADFLKWMPSNSDVLVYEDEAQHEASQKLVAEADLIYCLDFSCINRVGHKFAADIQKSDAKVVLIDHHIDPEDFADFVLWDHHASSTAELIYEYIVLSGGKDEVDVAIGECIYAGMMTDTGSFRFPSTSANVHRIIADLMEKGLDHSRIHRLVYDDNNETRLRLLGFALSERLEISYEYHTAFFKLSAEDLKRFDYRTGDTEGIVNYALSISGIVFAAFFSEKDGATKISFRSVGDFPANEFAGKYFNGGGHKNAAGGRTEEPVEEAVERFKSLLPAYKEQLDACVDALPDMA